MFLILSKIKNKVHIISKEPMLQEHSSSELFYFLLNLYNFCVKSLLGTTCKNQHSHHQSESKSRLGTGKIDHVKI